MPASGYGVGLFDKSGPDNFAKAISAISTALTGVQGTFTQFGSSAASSISTVASAINDLTNKLNALQSQLQNATKAAPGGGGGRQGGGMGRPGGGPGGAPLAANGTSLTSNGPLWVPSGAVDANGTFASGQPSMDPGTASRINPPSQHPPMQTPRPAEPGSQTPNQGGGQGGFNWGAAGTMASGIAGSVLNAATSPYAQSMISTSVQGATIGQMLGPAFGVNPRSLYVIPGGTLSQNAGDYAQANYYAMMNMGVAPGTGNWSTVQRGANQLMTLVPGMSRQGAMVAQNQLQQPGVLNRALAVGLNLRPSGQLQTPEQQYAQIFNRLTMGGQVNAKTFAAMMQPGSPGAVNLESIGIAPGTDAYYGFMQYAYTRLGQQAKGGNMPDVGTAKGAKQAGLDTPYYAQLQAQSQKSQLESRTEPGIAEAAKNLNQAAGALLNIANKLNVGGLIGGGIGGISKMFNPMSLLKSLTGGMFQSGGLVDGPLNQAMLAIVHGGERILTPGMLSGSGISPMSSSFAGLGSFGGFGSGGGLLGGIGDLFKKLFGGLGGGAGFSGGGSQGGVNLHIPSIARLIPGMLGVDRFFEHAGGDIGGAWHRGESDVHNWLKDIPGLGALFGGSAFGAGKGLMGGAGGFARRIGGDIASPFTHLGRDIGGVWHRGESDIHNWLKDALGLPGKAFGEAEGMFKGAAHKAGGLFHGIGHLGSGLFHGAEHLLGGLGKDAKDTVAHMLMGKLTDIKGSALHDLLSPVPKDSVLAAALTTATTKAPAAPVSTQQQRPAPKQTPHPVPAPRHHRKGGILGGIESFLGGVGGDIAGIAKGIGADFGQFFTGTPAAAQPMTTAPNGGAAGKPYSWSSPGSPAVPIDLSGMYATQKGSSTNSSSGSGGTGSSGTSGGAGNAGAGSKGGTPTGNVASWIAKAMQITGVSGADWTNGLNLIIQHESGGNPKATNNWDSNAAAGHPSQGLMQEIPSTFQQYAMPGYNSDITDPVSNVVAGIRYIQSRYHGINNVPGVAAVAKGGSYVGYARGSQLIDRTQLALLHKGEAVVSAADNYATLPYNRNGAMGGGGPLINLNFRQGSIVLQVPPTSSQQDMDNIANQFVAAISKPQLLAAIRSG